MGRPRVGAGHGQFSFFINISWHRRSVAMLATPKKSHSLDPKVETAMSMVNELDCGGGEFSVILEDRTVAGVGVDDEF